MVDTRKGSAVTVRILAVGRRHESWVAEGITRYERRLRAPFVTRWSLLAHSARDGERAREEESGRVLGQLSRDELVVLLDERGRALDSPALSSTLRGALDRGRPVALVIGGAYGVDERLRERADLVWSLSPLVFPHQLVRLIVVEQLYRAQEISAGRAYHHA